jgi:hypothetical protein
MLSLYVHCLSCLLPTPVLSNNATIKVYIYVWEKHLLPKLWYMFRPPRPSCCIKWYPRRWLTVSKSNRNSMVNVSDWIFGWAVLSSEVHNPNFRRSINPLNNVCKYALKFHCVVWCPVLWKLFRIVKQMQGISVPCLWDFSAWKVMWIQIDWSWRPQSQGLWLCYHILPATHVWNCGPIYVRHHVAENSHNTLMSKGKKGKAIPLQAWTGLWGSRRLRLPDF